MRFIVNREDFRKTLSIVRLAQGSGSNNEWVKGVKFETEGEDTLRLSASDSTTTISTALVGIKILEKGSMLLRGDEIDKITSFQEIGGDIEFILDNNMVKIVSGKDSGEYQIMDDTFVGIDLVGKDSWFTISNKLFLMADSKVQFAACKDNATRPKMQAVYFCSKDNVMDIVACDGHKLAKLVIEETIPDFSMLIRADVVVKISKALKDLVGVEGNVEICVTQDKMYLRSGNFIASANLIDSTYIKYDRIIPSTDNIKFSISCNRKELIRKVNFAGFANSTSKDSGGITNIGIKVGEDGIGDEGFLSIVSAKVSSNKQSGEISIIQEKGEIPSDFCIWVNDKFFAEVLKNVECEKIFLNFVDQATPFIVRDPIQENYLCLVMPQTKKKA